MKQVLISTSNAGKIKELSALLGGRFEVLSPVHARFHDKTFPKVVEDGETYFENALRKAMAFYKVYQVPVLSDDSGLEVDCLNGAPGVISADYGGEKLSWWERWQVLLKNVSTFPPEQRTARFRCVLCYYDGTGVPIFFQGTTEGRIAAEPKGDRGFGYDPIFYSTALNKTFGEADATEKMHVSHRAHAVAAFLRLVAA